MSSSESFFQSFRYSNNVSTFSNGSEAIVDKATCSGTELRHSAVAGERSSSGTVTENLQSIGDNAMIACVLVGGNEDITGFSNHDVIIDQEATAAVTLAPSKVTTKGVGRKVKEHPAAAERASRPGKRTKIESEFDKLTTLEQTMFIRSKQQHQQALFYSSSATGLSTCPLDSHGCSSSLELRQRELCELRRELSTVLSIGAEVRSRESKLKRAISRLQKEVASCLEPVQCAKEPAEPLREPLAQLFPLPKHGSVDVQQRCFNADPKADSIMWSLAHQSEEMPTFKAGLNLSDRCKDLVREFHISIGGSDTNDCVTTPQDQENDVEVVIHQDRAYTSIVPSSNHTPSHALNLTTVAEVDALCDDGDQATSSIVVELIAIKSHSSSSSSSPARGRVLQIVDLTGDTPQPTVRHVGYNEAVAECTENRTMKEDEVSPCDAVIVDEVSLGDAVIEDEVSSDDVVIEDEVSSDDVLIEDEVSLGDAVIEDEVSSDDVLIEDEVSLGDAVIEDEDSPCDAVIEDEVSPCDAVIEDEVSLGDAVIEDEVSPGDVVIEDEVSPCDAVIEDEVSLGDAVIEDEVSLGDAVIKDEVSLGDVVIENEVSSDDVVIEDEDSPCDAVIEDEVSLGDAVIENEVSLGDAVIEDEVSLGDAAIEDEVSLGDAVIEDEVSSVDAVMKDEVSPCDVVIEDEVSPCDAVIEDEVSSVDVLIEDEVSPCDVVIKDEVSPCDAVIKDEVSPGDVVIENEVSPDDAVMKDEVSPAADGLMDGTMISAVEESEVCSSSRYTNSSSAPTDRHCILHYDPPMNAAAVTSGCSSQLQSLSSSSRSSIVSASQQCHALEATSKPDFSAMPVSELRSIVLSYGLKIDRKANMVHLLSAMWHRLHPFHP